MSVPGSNLTTDGLGMESSYSFREDEAEEDQLDYGNPVYTMDNLDFGSKMQNTKRYGQASWMQSLTKIGSG
ncbi:hypothetical protein PoB_006810300 [Plakobranchus ocellatus]|uniref:Uncharacterized protein n=1 Tax=Plakobranchus ocellatus TaxID=259542 RepID=A0AAV4DBK8_9GAST|nr:hypothetical protein PoB_006810300 [Plakobranchus ocellatus]